VTSTDATTAGSTTGPAADLAPDATVIELFVGEHALANPAPYYHHLRTIAPVHHSATGATFLTRFDDCQRMLRDNRFGKSERRMGNGLIPDTDPEVLRFRQQQIRRRHDAQQPLSMLFLNPPDHTRQRSLVSRAFTPKRIEQLRSSIRHLADRYVDDLVERGGGDLLEILAFPFPVAVIGTLVGVPQTDWPQFRSLITAAAAGLEPGATLADLQAADAASTDVWQYFIDLVGERRARPQDDLLSDLIAVEESGDTLSEGEVIAVSILLFAAGFETTTNLIGNGVAALLRHPDQLHRLWNDRSLAPGAVEEILRWDSPVQLDVRVALEDTEFNGEPVSDGSAFVTLIGAANRDPDHFTDPDVFDITRGEGPALSFAAGIHYCLGANLSRAEGQEVIDALIDRCAAIELDGPLQQRRRITLRGLQSLPVRVTPR
jgi:cytochrome P450